MADTEFKDLTAMLGTELASGDSLLILDATGNVTKRIAMSEIIATQAEAEAGTEAERLMTPERTQDFFAANFAAGKVVHIESGSAQSFFGFNANELDNSDGYEFFRFFLIGVSPDTDGENVIAQVWSDSVGNWDTGTNYQFYIRGEAIGASAVEADDSASAHVRTTLSGVGNAAGEEGLCQTVEVSNLFAAKQTRFQILPGSYQRSSDGAFGFSFGVGLHTESGACSRVRFLASAGKISGTIVAVGYPTA